MKFITGLSIALVAAVGMSGSAEAAAAPEPIIPAIIGGAAFAGLGMTMWWRVLTWIRTHCAIRSRDTRYLLLLTCYDLHYLLLFTSRSALLATLRATL